MLKSNSLAAGLILLSSASVSALPADTRKPVQCTFGRDGVFTSAREYSIHKLHVEIEEYKYFDKNCDGKIDASEQADKEIYLKAEVVDRATSIYNRYKKYDRPIPANLNKPTPDAPEGGWAIQPVLRNSFEDISIFAGPKDVKAAIGASFNFTRDGEENNTIWSGKGVAALPFSWSGGPVEGRRSDYVPYLVGYALTPSVSFHRVTNSKASVASNRDVDVLTFGGGGEVAIGHLFDNTSTHYFRLRGALVSNFDIAARSWNLVAEYQPLTHWREWPNLSIPNPVGTLPITYSVDTILRAHYARKIDDDIDDPLFNHGKSVLRVGPVFSLGIYGLQGEYSPIPKWLQRASLTAGFSWLTALKNPQSYAYFMTAFNYALDDAGNIAVSVSYEGGKIDETGEEIDIAKIGISAKY